MSEISPAVPSRRADLGTVTLTFVAAGAIVIAAALAGFAWGVPTKMVWPDEGSPEGQS